MISASPAATSLDDVLARPDVWRGDRLANAAIPALASGFPVLDAQLPGGGWPRGALTEILADRVGLGECSLLMPALRRLRDEGKWCLLVAPPHALNAPAWTSVDLTRLIVVSPGRARDALWAAEQALSSAALGAVLCWTAQIDPYQVRRLEVAVAGSTTLSFLFRPARARRESSACALRLMLSAGSRGSLAVDLLKRRGPPCTRTLYLDVARPLDDDPTLARHPSPVSAARIPGLAVAA
jgi:protein ImuA